MELRQREDGARPHFPTRHLFEGIKLSVVARKIYRAVQEAAIRCGVEPQLPASVDFGTKLVKDSRIIRPLRQENSESLDCNPLHHPGLSVLSTRGAKPPIAFAHPLGSGVAH